MSTSTPRSAPSRSTRVDVSPRVTTGAGLLEDRRERVVALLRVASEPRHHHRAAERRGQRERVAGGGGVGLDGVIAAAQRAPGADVEARRRLRDVAAEVGDHPARDVDVGPADERALDLDVEIGVGEAGRHQQRREVLARLIAAHADAAAAQPAAADRQRRAARRARDVGAQRAQRVDQHVDRPLRHRVVADQRHLAVDERGDRREEADRRAAVADEQRPVGRVQTRTSAAHDERVAGPRRRCRCPCASAPRACAACRRSRARRSAASRRRRAPPAPGRGW